jgi:hypothetical protein
VDRVLPRFVVPLRLSTPDSGDSLEAIVSLETVVVGILLGLAGVGLVYLGEFAYDHWKRGK